MPAEMLSRVAAAIAEYNDATMKSTYLTAQDCDGLARAAIEAMQAPTSKVIRAGVRCGADQGFGVGYDDYVDLWRAMICAALAEDEEVR